MICSLPQIMHKYNNTIFEYTYKYVRMKIHIITCDFQVRTNIFVYYNIWKCVCVNCWHTDPMDPGSILCTPICLRHSCGACHKFSLFKNDTLYFIYLFIINISISDIIMFSFQSLPFKRCLLNRTTWVSNICLLRSFFKKIMYFWR